MWYAVYTKPKKEDSVAFLLQNIGLKVLNPKIKFRKFKVIKPSTFKNGDKVLIKDGPFKDFYGIFKKEIKGHERVMILLETIQCRVELDSYFSAVA